MPTNYKQIYAIQKKNEQRILAVNPKVPNESGIYFLTRIDEDGIKYAYIGQAKSLIQRLAQHLSGYMWIDLSIKKHGLYDFKSNPYGWMIRFILCPQEALDSTEQAYIKAYAQHGYQLRNKTAGGQLDKGEKINEYKPARGYRDGLKQGQSNLAKELRNIIDKHLVVSIKPEKANNKVSIKAFEKFKELVYGTAED